MLILHIFKLLKTHSTKGFCIIKNIKLPNKVGRDRSIQCIINMVGKANNYGYYMIYWSVIITNILRQSVVDKKRSEPVRNLVTVANSDKTAS